MFVLTRRDNDALSTIKTDRKAHENIPWVTITTRHWGRGPSVLRTNGLGHGVAYYPAAAPEDRSLA